MKCIISLYILRHNNKKQFFENEYNIERNVIQKYMGTISFIKKKKKK